MENINNIYEKNLPQHYSDNEIINNSIMEEMSNEYIKQGLLNGDYELDYSKVFILLKENCRLLYPILDFYEKRKNIYAYSLLQKIIVKCESLQKNIKPYCLTINNFPKNKHRANIKPCIINFCEIIKLIMFSKDFTNFKQLFAYNLQLSKTGKNYETINKEILTTCLNAIRDLMLI